MGNGKSSGLMRLRSLNRRNSDGLPPHITFRHRFVAADELGGHFTLRAPAG